MKRSGSLKGKAKKFKLSHTAYRLLDVKPSSSPITLKVKTEKGVRAGVSLVGRAGPVIGGTTETATKYLRKGGKAKVTLPNTSGYGRVTAVISNADGRVKGNSRNYTKDGIKFTASLGG